VSGLLSKSLKDKSKQAFTG